MKQKPKVWRTKSRVFVVERDRVVVVDRHGKPAIKIRCDRWPDGGDHGWLWLKGLDSVGLDSTYLRKAFAPKAKP